MIKVIINDTRALGWSESETSQHAALSEENIVVFSSTSQPFVKAVAILSSVVPAWVQ